MKNTPVRDLGGQTPLGQPLRVRSDSNEAVTWGRYVSLSSRPRLAYLVGRDAAWSWRTSPGAVTIVDRGDSFFD